MARWLVLQPHSKNVVGVILGLGPFCVDFASSHYRANDVGFTVFRQAPLQSTKPGDWGPFALG